MNKWILFATVSLIALLGASLTFFSHAGAHRSSTPFDADEPEGDDDGASEKGDNAFSLDEDPDSLPSPLAGSKAGAHPNSDLGSTVEMLEDDDENGVTVETGDVLDDDEGVLEPAVHHNDAARLRPGAKAAIDADASEEEDAPAARMPHPKTQQGRP